MNDDSNDNLASTETALETVDLGGPAVAYRHPDQHAVEVGQNPFVAMKERGLNTVIDQKFSLRRSCNFEPERGRLIVARIKANDFKGSIMMPDEVKSLETTLNMEVVVLSVGAPRVLDNGEQVPTNARPGRHGVIRQHAGIPFDWFDEFGQRYEVIVIGQSEILFWLNPVAGQPEITEELRRTLDSINPPKVAP